MNEVRTNRQGFSEVKCFELTLERLRDGELLIDSGMLFRTLAAVTDIERLISNMVSAMSAQGMSVPTAKLLRPS